MKKVLLFLLLVVFGASSMAQQSIQLRSADKAECVKSDMTSLKASFSFSTKSRATARRTTVLKTTI